MGLLDQFEDTNDSFSITESIKTSLETNITQEINTNSNILCRNIIVIDDAENCHISGIRQVCDASIIAKTVANEVDIQRYERTIARDVEEKFNLYIDEKLKDFADRWPEITDWKGKEPVSNIIKLTIESVAEVALHLRTDCSRNIAANNFFFLDNVTCTDLAKIQGSSQEINASIVSECAVNSAVRNEGSLNVASSISQQLEISTMKSDDMFTVLFLMLLFPFLLFLLPFIIRKSKTTLTPLITVIAIILVIVMIVWWPGYYAIEWGVWPWPYPGSTVRDSNGDLLCDQGKITKNVFMNEFVWFDAKCVASDADPCTPEDQLVHYSKCGLFGGKCDDPILQSDTDAYMAAANACAEAPISLGCEHKKLVTVFSDKGYPGCSYCGSTGLYAKEGELCDPDKFNLDKYASLELVCPENDGNCIESESEYVAASRTNV